MMPVSSACREDVTIYCDQGPALPGILQVPRDPTGLVLFAHGSGSSRFSRRNQLVAAQLHELSIATVLFDLLTPAEALQRDNVFNVTLLCERLLAATSWAATRPDLDLPLGYFGAGTGAAAALIAAARLGSRIGAVVSRGGRPDLASPQLAAVVAPTLFIVGARDGAVAGLNEAAARAMPGIRQLVVVPEATHLFEEAGALEEVTRLAGDWFSRYLVSLDGARSHAQPA